MACHVEVFQAVIKHGRVTAAGIDDGEYLFQIRKIRRCRIALPSVEPVYIALDGIDFAIVDDVTVWMGSSPAGKGIRAEAGMDEAIAVVKSRSDKSR